MGIWESGVFADDPIERAKLLFGYENPPGVKFVSGSQDHLGLVLPAINKLHYNGEYWPDYIESIKDDVETFQWLESVIYLVELVGRPENYEALAEQNFYTEVVERLGKSGDDCYEAIKERDVVKLGKAISETYECWKIILPRTVPQYVRDEVENLLLIDGVHGCEACHGGGYIIVVSSIPIDYAIKVEVSY